MNQAETWLPAPSLENMYLLRKKVEVLPIPKEALEIHQKKLSHLLEYVYYIILYHCSIKMKPGSKENVNPFVEISESQKLQDPYSRAQVSNRTEPW